MNYFGRRWQKFILCSLVAEWKDCGRGKPSSCSCRHSRFQPRPLETVSKCYFSSVPFTINCLCINKLHPGKFEETYSYSLLKRNVFGLFMVKPKVVLVSIVYYLRPVNYINCFHSVSRFNKAFNNALLQLLYFFRNDLSHSNAAIFLLTENFGFIPSDCA